MEPSDEALVLACRQGDTTAWETLVARYQRIIYSIPRRAGLNDDLAADVFQHVFATLVEKLHTIEQPERIGAWLVTTARRESWRISKGERAVVRPTTDDEGIDQIASLPDTEPLPEEQLLRNEARQHVREALEKLDERCRTLMILLFYKQTPSYSEVAALLGTSEGSIGPTRARCLEKVRKLLYRSI